MRSFITLIAIFAFLSSGFAQPITKSSYDVLLTSAEEQAAFKNYFNALELYEEAYDEEQDRALAPKIAELHYQLRDYNKAERWYKRLFRREKDAAQYAAYRFPYGRVLKMNGNYPEAIEVLQLFIAETDNDSLRTLAKAELTGAEMALEMPDVKKGVTIENIGRTVNTSSSEYSPTLARDGQTMYFTAFKENKTVITVDEKNTDYHAKVFKATKSDKGWSKPEELDESVNRPGAHQSNVALSPDGRIMFLTRSVLEGNTLKFSKLYYSFAKDDGWAGVEEVAGVNGDYIVKQPAVGDLFGKEVIIFASDMDGGYGGFDLYYATRKSDGVYSDPINLGEKINTTADEETPFYRDGTLYFSSNGHPGLGGFDIFYTVWDGSTWSEPLNMGKGYNSPVDDYSLTLDGEGYTGALTSNREGGRSLHGRTCCDDIYTFEIAKLYADLIVGVFDGGKKVLKGATVKLVELEEDQAGKSNQKTSEKGNRFDFGLNLEKAYRIVATKEGFFPDSMEINTVGLTEAKTFKERLFLKEMPKPPPEPEYDTITIEEAIVLENILYDFDDDRIKQEAEPDLEVVFELMNEYPEMKIELGSHTDNRGNDDYNADLSQRRAESARRWLIRKGIARARIEAKGYGESEPQTVTDKVNAKHSFLPVETQLTEEYIDALSTNEEKEVAHELNRRTEFKILEGPTSIVIKSTRLKKKPAVKKPVIKRSRNRGSNIIAPNHYDSTIVISELSSLHGTKDLKGVPIMQFEERMVDFGTVKKGEKRYHTYTFKNVGDTELKISLVTACECTTTDYSYTKVYKPGDIGEIDVTFDSKDKDYPETIDIDIILDNVVPTSGNPIIEKIQYKFDIEQ